MQKYICISISFMCVVMLGTFIAFDSVKHEELVVKENFKRVGMLDLYEQAGSYELWKEMYESSGKNTLNENMIVRCQKKQEELVINFVIKTNLKHPLSLFLLNNMTSQLPLIFSGDIFKCSSVLCDKQQESFIMPDVKALQVKLCVEGGYFHFNEKTNICNEFAKKKFTPEVFVNSFENMMRKYFQNFQKYCIHSLVSIINEVIDEKIKESKNEFSEQTALDDEWGLVPKSAKNESERLKFLKQYTCDISQIKDQIQKGQVDGVKMFILPTAVVELIFQNNRYMHLSKEIKNLEMVMSMMYLLESDIVKKMLPKDLPESVVQQIKNIICEYNNKRWSGEGSI